MKVSLPWPSRALSPNSRCHWSKKAAAAKKARRDAYLITRASGLRIDWEGDIHLWLTFYPPDRRNRDDDNIIAAFKSYRDGIAEALGIDDKRFRLRPWVSDTVVKGGSVTVAFTKGPEVCAS